MSAAFGMSTLKQGLNGFCYIDYRNKLSAVHVHFAQQCYWYSVTVLWLCMRDVPASHFVPRVAFLRIFVILLSPCISDA